MTTLNNDIERDSVSNPLHNGLIEDNKVLDNHNSAEVYSYDMAKFYSALTIRTSGRADF